MFRIKTVLLNITFIGGFVLGNIIHVPENEPTIQAGIDAVSFGDTVLVSPGTYLENINFRGKNIVVASHYLLNEDPVYIESTIIDGSNPSDPDTASCVLIVSGEDTTAVLEGFTLTGGKGTKWTDEHGHGVYFEGGGILITLSSPTIKNNHIVRNEAIRHQSGIESAGGGGIRCGDGSPRILFNVIESNTGMYGGGIVMNYASGIIKHNVIVENRVYKVVKRVPSFGGGGIWVYGSQAGTIIENNTIIGNSSEGAEIGNPVAGRGGGILAWETKVNIHNNIIWNNSQMLDKQIESYLANATITFNNIQDGWSGEGNIQKDPVFCDPTNGDYHLAENSPCIGMGALGIGCGTILSSEKNSKYSPSRFILYPNFPNPFNPVTKIEYEISEQSFVSLVIYDLLGSKVKTLVQRVENPGLKTAVWDATNDHHESVSAGVYLFKIEAGSFSQKRKMILLK